MAQRNPSPYFPPELSSASSNYPLASRILPRAMTGLVFAMSLHVGAPLFEFWLKFGTSASNGAIAFLYHLAYVHPTFQQFVLFILWPTVLYVLYCWQADRQSIPLQIVLAMISANVTHWAQRLKASRVYPFVKESFGLDFYDNHAIFVVSSAVFLALAVSAAYLLEVVVVFCARHAIPSVPHPQESIA